MQSSFTRKFDYSPFISWLARFIFRVLGWKTVGELPPYPKMVLVAAYHTSTLDGAVFFFSTLIWRVRLNYLGKDTLFRGPFGIFFRWSGGIPIDRTISSNVVDQAIHAFNERDQMLLVLAPEGTRKKATYWKTGFYYIALGAKVPIGLGYADYRTRSVGVGKVIFPSGDIEADMQIIREFYAKVTPRHAEKVGPIGVPPK